MNKLIIAAALAAASFAALAESPTYDHPQPVTFTVSRAEVQAQTALAAARGEIVGGELSYVAPAHGPALSRTEVRLALDAARRNNELDGGEMGLAPELQRIQPTRVARR